MQKKSTTIDNINTKKVNQALSSWKRELLESNLSTSTKLVGFIISEHFNKKTLVSYPTINTICELASFGSRNTAIKAIKELEQEKLIHIDKKLLYGNSRPTNIYSLDCISAFNMSFSEPSFNDGSRSEPSNEPSNEPSFSVLEPNKPSKPKKEKINKKEKFILSKEREIQEPLRRWLDYRKDKLKTIEQWEFQYNKLSKFNNPNEVVNYSVGQGYQGLYEEKNPNSKPKIDSKRINQEKLKELWK